ncbi:mitochondrial import inner membrane translocase subunit Tim10B [Eupeodes corollae]|uniref:mitochondrial import inner membrane translocase subunit Tim10B n=1 Tax=Eupeodes corollae TaxID=290404 RepID=UPI0024929FD6|nr:mitochondrial import inner membrane translocase subunit Tim10B [Eupeodes corollae]
MDSQIRNFKDFLLLYNKVTELCFTSCVDNFFTRNIGINESECVDKCVTKFARFNQSMMSVYVEVQTDINFRRNQELEAATKQAAEAAAANASAAPPSITIQTPTSDNTIGSVSNATV